MSQVNNLNSIASPLINEVGIKKSVEIRNKHKFDFDKCVNTIINENIKISAHANERLTSRNIRLSETDMKCINNAIDKMDNKGAKETLILYNDLALIASVKNRTIITAMDKNALEEKVFTNIDSAIII